MVDGLRASRRRWSRWLIGIGVVAIAGSAVAQQAQPYMDRRYKNELSLGAPPEGAPKAPDVPRGPGSLTGVWYNLDIPRLDAQGNRLPDEDPLMTDQGKPPPFLPWVTKLMAERRAASKEGHPWAGPRARCLSGGTPGALLGPRLVGFDIIETPDKITILVEDMDHFRQIFLNAKHDPHAKPSYFGDSIGHWEGDTLVVETTNLTTDSQMPHSPELKVTERIQRVSKDRLAIKVTYDDPKAFSAPWTTVRRTQNLRPGHRLIEYVCNNNRNGADANGVTQAVLQSK